MGNAHAAQEGLAMAKMSGKHLAAIVAIGAALSFGIGAAFAEDVTEDQILKALAPSKKPLTRGLSAGPQADPAATAAETRFVTSIRGRTTRSLSQTEAEENAPLVKDKPKIDLEINFAYKSADISAKYL